LVSEQHGSWSDCADAQAGLDPCWSQTHYVGFVVTRLKLLTRCRHSKGSGWPGSKEAEQNTRVARLGWPVSVGFCYDVLVHMLIWFLHSVV
jgi:hypothetical protein